MKHVFARIGLAAFVIGSSASAFALPHHHAAAVHKALDADDAASKAIVQPVVSQPTTGALPWYLDPALATKVHDSLQGDDN